MGHQGRPIEIPDENNGHSWAFLVLGIVWVFSAFSGRVQREVRQISPSMRWKSSMSLLLFLGLIHSGQVRQGVLKATTRIKTGLLRKVYYSPLAIYKTFLYSLGSDEPKVAESYPDRPTRDHGDFDTPFHREVPCLLLCKKTESMVCSRPREGGPRSHHGR